MSRLREALSEINEEIRKFNAHRNRQKPVTITPNEAYELYKKYDGKCVYCGFNLRVTGRGSYGSHFQFLFPLEYGGEVSKDNIALVCNKHKKKYEPKKRLRERIPDLDSFADLIENLTKAVCDREEAIKHKDPQTAYHEEKVRRLKHEINLMLEDISVHLYYKCFLEDEPQEVVVRKEGKNTIADAIEKAAEGKEEAKEEISENVKQVMKTKQYKVFVVDE